MSRPGRRILSSVDRNALERSRRLHMKELVSRLAFLLPPAPSKAGMHGSRHIQPSVPRVLDQAAIYVKQLGERVEMLKQKKQLLEGGSAVYQTSGVKDDMVGGSSSPVFTVRELDFVIEVNIMSGSHKFMLHQVIQVLEEEAAQVVGLSYSNVGEWTHCTTIKAQAVSPRIGIETSRVQERLKELLV